MLGSSLGTVVDVVGETLKTDVGTGGNDYLLVTLGNSDAAFQKSALVIEL